jgi:twitching motility protein PilJ
MAGALVGLGSMAAFFYNSLRTQVETDIRITLTNRVNLVNGQMKQAEALGRALRDGVAALHQQGVQNPEVYKRLTFQMFLGRPPGVIGMGFGQPAYGVLQKQQWFYPYYMLDPGTADAPGVKLPAPHSNIRFVSENQAGDFYPEQDYWKTFMATQKTVWDRASEPYFGVFYTNFYLPIYDANKKWIGSLNVDFDSASFNESLQGNVIQQTGYFALLDEKGAIISYPRDTKKVDEGKTFTAISGLRSAWTQVTQGKSGLVNLRGTYWAYERIPASPNWIALASVPSEVVLRPVLLITVGGAVLAAALLAIVVFIAVRYLNRRLKPILQKCNELAAMDAEVFTRLNREDEIGQLDVSFNNLISRLDEKEQQVRQEVARSVQSDEQLKQAAREKAESDALQTDVGHLLDMVSAVEEGDLTVQAPVSDRVTGLVADTFNRLVEELAQVMSQVLGAARQMSTGVSTLEQIANAVATNANQQAQSVNQTLQLSEQVEQSVQDSAQQIQATNRSLSALSQTVAAGQAAIATLTQGTEVLHQGSDRIIQQMKTLGEFVGLAEQFVQDQNQIATQTQVLAMNASLVAARAAEQQNPRQFIVAAREFEAIADQVSRLAQQTNESLAVLEQRTTQIQTVVSAIDADVQNLGGLVGGFTRGVEQSNQVFKDVQMVAAEAVSSSEVVAYSNELVVKSFQSTAAALQDIANLAQQTVQLTQTTQSQSEAMGSLSAQLLQRVEFFRLPAALMSQAANTGDNTVDLSQADESTIEITSTTVPSS